MPLPSPPVPLSLAPSAPTALRVAANLLELAAQREIPLPKKTECLREARAHLTRVVDVIDETLSPSVVSLALMMSQGKE